MFGFLNIYKPVGMTSHDVVGVLRKTLKIKQIGHTGTLDPFAEGVLPICIGKATRLIEYLKDDKEYLATVQFGASTTTYDIEGEKTFTSNQKVVCEQIKDALKTFEGEILQTPPIYSAIKVKGKKLYEYARKGEDVEIQPRKVFIEKIELKSYNENSQQAQILIKCSKGTYIRSIANDLGEKLQCGGHLIKLVRTQAGKFRVENTIQLADVSNTTPLINPLDMLDLPIIEISDAEIGKIKHGMPIDFRQDNIVANNFVLVYNKTEVCAIGEKEKDKIKLKKVFIQ